MGWESKINHTIYLTAQNINRAGFGGTVVLTEDVTYATATYKRFTDPDDVTADTEVGTKPQAWAADFFSTSPHGEALIIGKGTADAGDLDSTAVSDDLDSIKSAMDEDGVDAWHVGTTSRDADVIVALAGWCDGKSFFPVIVSADDAVKDGDADNAFEELSDASSKALAIYHATSDEYPDAEICALKSALDTELTGGRGHTRYEWTKLGVTGQDSLTTGEKTTITGNGGSICLTTAGEVVLAPCKGPDGYWPDEWLTNDWIEARLDEEILGLLIQESTANRKVGYTRQGFAQIADAIKNVLELCVDTGKASEYSFDPPKRSEATTSDVSSRIYRYTADITMSGGILQINGSIYLGR